MFGTGRCNAKVILGSWRGSAITDPPWSVQVDYTFDFNSDGSYLYRAGQGNFEWLSHQGTFKIDKTRDQRYPCQIALTPSAKTIRINPQNRLGVAPLQGRDLMDDQPRTFFYKESPRPGSLILAGTWTDWANDIGCFSLQRR
jgi:hypothetical protein